jgi:hypothetical protein
LSAIAQVHHSISKFTSSWSVSHLQALYRDKAELESGVRQNLPGFKDVGKLEYGFKIRDRAVPEKWYLAENIVKLPAEEDVPRNPMQGLQQSLGGLMNNIGGKKKT